MQTSIETMMGLAETEIKEFIKSTMENNKIPYGIMSYILKSILLDFEEQTLSVSNNHFLDLQMQFQNLKNQDQLKQNKGDHYGQKNN